MAVSIVPLPHRVGSWLCRTVRRGLWFGLLICACVGAAETTARADFDTGWQAYQRGDFALAVAEWWPLAKQGHALSQYNMGVIYDEGRGVEQSRAQAMEWWTMAADQGLPIAQHNLALMYIDTLDERPDIERAIQLLEKASAKGFIQSSYSLAKIYVDGVGVPKDEDKGLALMSAAGEAGFDKAQYNLGKMYRDGRGVAADQSQAAKWFRIAAEQGYAKAQNKLAIIYSTGRGAEPDDVEALKWAILADRQGHGEAKENRAALTKRLRVRPETLCRITEFSEHESNGRELDEGERVAVEVLPVLGQSAAAVEPGDGAFDHPTPGLDDEALHPIGSLDDLGLEIGQDAGQGAVKDRALIGAVGEQFPEKGKQTEQGRQQRETAVAILNVGGGDDAVQQQALRIDQKHAASCP